MGHHEPGIAARTCRAAGHPVFLGSNRYPHGVRAERGHRVEAFDLYDWGYGASPVDFLTWQWAGEGGAPWTCLMNPPCS